MIDEFLKEIEELKQFKSKYESQAKDKQQMSDMLYDLMLERYNNKSYEERKLEYKNNMCHCCRYGFSSDYCPELPEDIGKPIPSGKAWIPATTSCKAFEWD